MEHFCLRLKKQVYQITSNMRNVFDDSEKIKQTDMIGKTLFDVLIEDEYSTRFSLKHEEESQDCY